LIQHKKTYIKRKKCQKTIKEAATVVPSDLHIQVRKFEREFNVIVQFAGVKWP